VPKPPPQQQKWKKEILAPPNNCNVCFANRM
jgi:hypothetical protein